VSQVIGLGLTHYPMLAGADTHMANLLKSALADPDIPAEAKDPANWSELARSEWSDDEGAAAAGVHRARLRSGLKKSREALDAFRPDLLIVWGDDQYENFRKEVVPSFCVLAYGDTEVETFAVLKMLKVPNAWGKPDDSSFLLRGAPQYARRLASDVLGAGVDIAYSYVPRRGAHFPHAFANTQIFLDYDQAGTQFPYPIVPVAVNCYGEHVIARRGGMARFADIGASEQLDPPGPSPARCFELGRTVARSVASHGERVALIASSSWSHAFLNDKAWHIHPDTPADRRLYDAMLAGDYEAWCQTSTAQVVSAGQHEMLNWFCLLGAMAELGLSLTWSDFVETEIFNSNKAFALFE
jgi:hypothetical protein